MDYAFLKAIGQVAGIAGLGLGVFLFIYREVIRKSIFPTLDKQHAYWLLRLIIILTFVISLTGIIVWFISDSVFPEFNSPRISVKSAIYGVPSSNFSRECDATGYIINICNGKKACSFPINNYICGDPAYGYKKVMEIVFSCGSETFTSRSLETGWTKRDMMLSC